MRGSIANVGSCARRRQAGALSALLAYVALTGCVAELGEFTLNDTSSMQIDGGHALGMRADSGATSNLSDAGGSLRSDADRVATSLSFASAGLGSFCRDGASFTILVLSREAADCAELVAAAGQSETGSSMARIAIEDGHGTGTIASCSGEPSVCQSASIEATITGSSVTWTRPDSQEEQTLPVSSCDFSMLGTSSSGAPAADLTVGSLSLFQAVEVPLIRNGAAVASTTPIVAGRDAVVRVSLSANPGFVPRELELRLELEGAPRESRIQTISGSTSFEFDLPSSRITPSTRIAVGAFERGATCAPATGGARAPASGFLSLSARDVEPFTVKVVPVRYAADGSSRVPDLSAARVQALRDRIYRMFPVSAIDLSVREAPLDFATAITADGNGWSELLNACASLRSSDRPASHVHYHCLVAPSATSSGYCGRGCVAGVGFVPSARNPEFRVSTSLGYGGLEDAFVHELGHTLGRPHAPCGSAADPDPSYPYRDGTIGVPGLDLLSGEAKPTSLHDIMSYCGPYWISDYTYREVFSRLGLERVAAYSSAAPTLYRSISIGVHGQLSAGDVISVESLPAGDRFEARWILDGGLEAPVQATLIRLDHVEGGIVYVPVPSGRARALDLGVYGRLQF